MQGLRLKEAFRFNRLIAANLRVKAVSEVLVKAVRLLLLVAAARVLGPAEFGLYTFAFAFASILSNAADFGLHLQRSREVARAEEPAPVVLGHAVRAKLMLSLIVTLLLLAGAWIYPRPWQVRGLILLAGAWLLAQSWCELWNYHFRGLQSLREEAMLNLLNAFTGTALGLTLLLSGGGVFILYAALLASALLTNATALLLLSRRGELPRRTALPHAWSALKEAAPLGLALLLTTLYFRIDMLFLESMRGDAEVGAYGAAYRILESFLFLPALLLAALYPALAEAGRSRLAEMERLCRAGVRWMLIIACGITAGLVLLAGLALGILYGSRYAEAIPILRLLAPSLLFIYPNFVLTHLLAATRGQKWNAILAGVGVVVNAGLNLPAIHAYGARGAAVATLVTEVALFACALLAVRHRFHVLSGERAEGSTAAAADMGGL